MLSDASKAGLNTRSSGAKQDDVDRAIVESILSGLFMNAAKYVNCNVNPYHPNMLHRRCANDSAYRSLLLQSKEDVKLFHFHPTCVYSDDSGKRPPEFVIFQVKH